MFETRASEALLVACFAAPTSAGVLFTLLAAAGLGTSWVFKKARVLTIFDDLSTLLLLIPLQMLFVGWRSQLVVVALVTTALLAFGYRWLNRSTWPVGKQWLLLYACALTSLCYGLDAITRIHLEVLLPSFVMGCILRHRGLQEGDDPHSLLDQGVKSLFMFLVGCSLPRMTLGSMSIGMVLVHVLALTLLSNVGKCIPLFCYAGEATRRERLALSIAMFPRGEVGAGVLLMSVGYGIQGLPVMLGSLSLALNLLLTGVFIYAVRKLLH